MISYDNAFRIIKDNLAMLIGTSEDVPILSSAGRILAADITSDINLPPFRNSAMDGFAIIFSPVREWNIIGSVSAGNYQNYSADSGSAVEIMTGAKIPEGFNTVIPVEDIERDGDRLIIKDGISLKQGMNIRNAGEDLKQGEIILPKNRLIRSKDIAALAAAGKIIVPVYKKIKAAVLSTGDELVDITNKPGDDKIRASNLYALLAAVEETKMEPVNLGIIKDEKELIREKITFFLNSENDILITTGGVSAGKYDFLKEMFIDAGIGILFHKVNIKPGKPVLFGKYEKEGKTKIIMGLPGNPVSALVVFYILIKKALMIIYGESDFIIPAELKNDIKKADSKRHFIRGNIEKKGDKFLVSCSSLQSSGNIAQLASADCLIIIDEKTVNPVKGDILNCMMI